MPEQIVLEDGTVKEVPSEEELKALQSRAALADSITQEKEKLEKEKAELESAVSPDWRQVRQKIKTMEEKLTERGLVVDAEGNIKEPPKGLDEAQVIEKSTRAAQEVVLNAEKNRLLSRYDDETKKVISHYYDKLTTGEQVNMDNLSKFISDAAILAIPDRRVASNYRSINGKPPTTTREIEVTESTLEMADHFGIANQFKKQ